MPYVETRFKLLYMARRSIADLEVSAVVASHCQLSFVLIKALILQSWKEKLCANLF